VRSVCTEILGQYSFKRLQIVSVCQVNIDSVLPCTDKKENTYRNFMQDNATAYNANHSLNEIN
jgi:hypothetical protein